MTNERVIRCSNNNILHLNLNMKLTSREGSGDGSRDVGSSEEG